MGLLLEPELGYSSHALYEVMTYRMDPGTNLRQDHVLNSPKERL